MVILDCNIVSQYYLLLYFLSNKCSLIQLFLKTFKKSYRPQTLSTINCFLDYTFAPCQYTHRRGFPGLLAL